jgi:hypothetical protein
MIAFTSTFVMIVSNPPITFALAISVRIIYLIA